MIHTYCFSTSWCIGDTATHVEISPHCYLCEVGSSSISTMYRAVSPSLLCIIYPNFHPQKCYNLPSDLQKWRDVMARSFDALEKHSLWMEHVKTTTFCSCKLLRRREDRNWRNASYSTDAGKRKMRSYGLNKAISTLFSAWNMATLGDFFQSNPLYKWQPPFFLSPSGEISP